MQVLPYFLQAAVRVDLRGAFSYIALPGIMELSRALLSVQMHSDHLHRQLP